MLDFDEAFARFAADALRWGIGREEIGMLGFERLEAAHAFVVLGVGDLRAIEYVVKVLVVMEFLA
jgi:hypothetical protein